jgi:uncharacterized protein (DUF2126 family)
MIEECGLTLTQGGEPTFVPHDTSAPEWNVAALGAEKLAYARKLARRLHEILLPGAVILQSFGKQFPGEPLPRWQIGLYRRRDGEPVWRDVERIRLDQDPIPEAHGDMALKLIRGIARQLSLPGKTIQPAFEDFEAALRAASDDKQPACLPVFSPRKKRFIVKAPSKSLMDAHEDCFQPAGWMLPLGWEEGEWFTWKWEVEGAAAMTLIPGDSPVGLRLPLGRLPKDALRTALTVEVDSGELVVFVPPVDAFEAFAGLMQAIESVARRLKLPPIRLEGYPPPKDEDMESIAFMSDPGVIEVNLPPAGEWAEFDRVVRGVFDAAEASGLRGFKFQLSGRKIATGGGSHIILGGPDLETNPFIHQPALLASFLRFVQNHPSLSYVFSGLFTGPSCQAPRVDESAFELPYELEITLAALERMPQPGDAARIDAMLRNLLMDWNGNTHRAEISVDKFHNQDAPNGRLGLIEFRAFEMVPTADMHLVANLLLRSLAAAFARESYRSPLIDWREALHDRFALPWFLRRDLVEVIGWLNERGFEFDPAWFEPQIDFRFPIVTAFAAGGAQWTLRQAIEPWPVMGDHTGSGRVVDATTDRLELLAVTDGDAPELVAIVNGIRLPLRSQAGGCAVGGLRYRLFTNPWGLQPQVRAHTPLSFEIITPGDGRIVHAFDYLNWKRDQGDYDGLPRDEADANQRVLSRVLLRDEKCGAKAKWREVDASPQAPLTLDLRRWP